MIRLLVRAGIAASFLTLTLALYLLSEVHNSRARFEKKINALHTELHSTQKNLTRTEQLLTALRSDILTKQTQSESFLRLPQTVETPSQTSSALCEIPNNNHVLLLKDKSIVRQILIHLTKVQLKHCYMTLNAAHVTIPPLPCRWMSRSIVSPSAFALKAKGFKCASTASTRTCT